jgi:hypothetical protein
VFKRGAIVWWILVIELLAFAQRRILTKLADNISPQWRREVSRRPKAKDLLPKKAGIVKPIPKFNSLHPHHFLKISKLPAFPVTVFEHVDCRKSGRPTLTSMRLNVCAALEPTLPGVVPRRQSPWPALAQPQS